MFYLNAIKGFPNIAHLSFPTNKKTIVRYVIVIVLMGASKHEQSVLHFKMAAGDS